MPPPRQVVEGASNFDKMKMGAIMGTGVGLTIGLIFGLTSIIRAGPGPRGTVATLSSYMLGSAATFGFFMSIGSVIRTESQYPLLHPSPTNRVSPYQLAWAQASQRRKLEVEVLEKRP